MGLMKSSKVQQNEVVKASDIDFGFESQINNVSVALQGIIDATRNFIVAKPDVVEGYDDGSTMNIKINPIFGICHSTGIPFVNTEVTEPIAIGSGWTVDRIDTIEVKGTLTDEVEEQRAFIDFDTKQKTLQNVKTQKWHELTINVKHNENDGQIHATAPATSSGYVKIAEIFVPANATAIDDCTIYNIDTDIADVEIQNWTNEKTATYNIGYITNINARFRHDHNNDGTHKASVIGKNELNLNGGDTNTFTSKNLRVGDSVSLNGESYATNTAVSDMIKILANKITDLFNKYLKNGVFNFDDDLSLSTILTGDTTLSKVLTFSVSPDGIGSLKLLNNEILSIQGDKLLVGNNYDSNTGVTPYTKELATRAVTNYLNGLCTTLRTDVDYILNNLDPTAASNRILSKFSVCNNYIRVATTNNLQSLQGSIIVDGKLLNIGDLVLVKDQTDASENGIYEVSSGAWTRGIFNTSASLTQKFFNIEEGVENIGKQFFTVLDTLDIDTTPIEFVESIYSQKSNGNKVVMRSQDGLIEMAKDQYTDKLYAEVASDDNGNAPSTDCMCHTTFPAVNNQIKQGNSEHNFIISSRGFRDLSGLNVPLMDGHSESIKVTFLEDCFCPIASPQPDLDTYPKFSVDGGVNYHKVYVNQHGTPILIPCHKVVSRVPKNAVSPITNGWWWWQSYTTLELVFIPSLDNNNGGWLVMNSDDIVLSSSDENLSYTVKANGLIEQFGETPKNVSIYTIYLPVKYNNTPVVLATGEYEGSTTGGGSTRNEVISSLTTSSFQIDMASEPKRSTLWKSCGY